jgi:hypothetical protein
MYLGDKEAAERLKARGHRIEEAYVRHDGKIMWVISGVAMFRPEAVELAEGRTTLGEIVARKQSGR